MTVKTEKVAFPAQRFGKIAPDRAPITVEPEPPNTAPLDTLLMAGCGVAIGTWIGASAGVSKRNTLASGVAGGAVALVMHNIATKGVADNLALTVRQGWALTRETFSRLVGYSPRTIAGYESGSALGAVPLRRYTEAQRLRAALEKVMQPEFVTTWLTSPNPAFDGGTPIQVIERGEIDRVWASVHYLDSGMS